MKTTLRDKNEIRDMVEEELNSLSTVMDVTQSMKDFNKLKYCVPKEYKPKEIVKLWKKLHISQAVFAYILNAKLTTVQKWEQGVNHPNGVLKNLLMKIEHCAIITPFKLKAD